MKGILSFLTACFLCIGVTDAAVRTTNSNARNTANSTQSSVSQRSGTTKNVSIRTNAGTQRATISRNATTNVSRTATQRDTNTIARTTSTNTTRTAVARTATKPSRIVRAATDSKTFGSGYNTCRDAYFTCMDQFCATADDSYRRCICSSRLDEIKTKQRALGDAADQIQNFKDLNIDVIPKTAAEVNAMLNASDGEKAASVAKDVSASAQKLAGISSILANTKSKSLSTAGTLDIAGDINAIWATTDLASGVNIANLSGETLYNAVHSQCADLVAQHCESTSTLNMVIAAYGMYIENDCTILSNALDKKKNSANAAIRETEREMYDARLQNYNAHNATSIHDCVAKVRNDITADTACGQDYIHCLDVSGMYLNRITGEPIYTANFYQLETMLSLSGDVLTNQSNRLLVAELNRKRNAAEKSLSTCQDLADDVWDEFMRQAITEIYQGQQSRIRQVKDECLDVVNKCYDSQTASLRDFSNTKEQLLLGAQLELSEQLCQEKLDACSNLYGGGPNGLQELVATMRNITSQAIAQNCLATLQEYVQTLCAVPSNDTTHSYPYACRVYAPGEQKYALDWKCQNAQSAVIISSGSDTRSSSNTSQSSRAPSRAAPTTTGDTTTRGGTSSSSTARYVCDSDAIIYTKCNRDYFFKDCLKSQSNGGAVSIIGLWPSESNKKDVQKAPGNICINMNHNDVSAALRSQSDVVVPGGTTCPYQTSNNSGGGDDPTPNVTTTYICEDYVGSLYQKVVRYALQACMRPSETENINTDGTEQKTPISQTVLQDVNATMDSVRIAMSNELQQECERLGGYWVPTQFNDTSTETTTGQNIDYDPRFYEETGANKKWGYCANANAAEQYYGTTSQ
ncbi:MAG: hypothetical protein J5679_00030 [Alphaproteobacteria bacterium]|nr:hypothetical protein [Alphaproteobacteria bacterium]